MQGVWTAHYWTSHSVITVASQPTQIAIITDDPGWHGRELKTAMHAHGLHANYVSLTACEFRFDDQGTSICIPGFEDRLPLGVFVRGVPGGSLEQVIFRLDILHALTACGTLVYNDSRAIERTVDKAMTTWLLKRAGIPTPATWVLESPEQACQVCKQEIASGNAVVLKPLFGSQGIGISLVRRLSDLPEPDTLPGLYYLQRFIEPAGQGCSDARVFVINHKAVAAMRRRSDNWLTNRAQGASCEPQKLDNELKTLAEAAVVAVDIDYAGVDIITDRRGNHQVIEVNSIPAWWGLQGVTDVHIAGLLIEHFVRRIGENHSMTVLS